MSHFTAFRKHAPVVIIGAGVLAGAVCGPPPEARETARRGHDAGAENGKRREAGTAARKSGSGADLSEMADFATATSFSSALDAPGLDRDLRVVAWLARATVKEVAAAAAWLERTRGNRMMTDDTVYTLLLARWLELDRAGALRGASERYTALRALAKLDPAAALEAAKGDAFHFNSVVSSIGQEDPEAAVALLRDFPGEEDAAVAWTGIMEGLPRKDPERAAKLAWTTGSDPGPAAEAWARRDPEAAAAWAEKLEGGHPP